MIKLLETDQQEHKKPFQLKGAISPGRLIELGNENGKNKSGMNGKLVDTNILIYLYYDLHKINPKPYANDFQKINY